MEIGKKDCEREAAQVTQCMHEHRLRKVVLGVDHVEKLPSFRRFLHVTNFTNIHMHKKKRGK